MESKKILIVEDDFLNRRIIKTVLKNNGYQVFEAKNAAIATKTLKENKIDLAILDINLGENERNGISLGDEIHREFHVPFIYLTAYDNAAVLKEAISTAPLSYLTKPFKESDLIAGVELALFNFELKENDESTIIVKDGDYKVELPINNVDYIESEGNYLLVRSDNKTYKCRSTISQILTVLPPDSFVQTHRAFVVNKAKIEKYNAQQVLIKNISIPISKRYRDKLL